jgi:hypothetical protein
MKKKRKRWQRSSYFQLFLFDHVIQKGPPRFVGAGLLFFQRCLRVAKLLRDPQPRIVDGLLLIRRICHQLERIGGVRVGLDRD